MVEYPEHTTRDDKEIKKMIHNVLVWNPDIDATKIDIVIQNGKVALSGTVENFWQKLKIERLVWDILGVIDVTDKIAVAPTEEFEDKIIAETIMKAIDRNMNIDANSVNVKVENGKVFLSGIVSNKIAHDAAVDLIENIAGVVNLENNLVVKNKR
jgi:osmotically-inducible protein OsmY